MRRWLTLLVCPCAISIWALSICALSNVATASAAKATPLKGIYGTVIKSGNPALNGTWLINFVADGTYVVVKEPHSKTLLIGGDSTVSGKTVTLVDKTGPFRCTGTSATGKYSWKFKGTTLTFTRVKDSCVGRPLVFASTTWTRIA